MIVLLDYLRDSWIFLVTFPSLSRRGKLCSERTRRRHMGSCTAKILQDKAALICPGGKNFSKPRLSSFLNRQAATPKRPVLTFQITRRPSPKATMAIPVPVIPKPGHWRGSSIYWRTPLCLITSARSEEHTSELQSLRH